MNIVVQGRNIEVSEVMRDYVAKKLSKLERFFDRLMDATVNFTLERGRIKVESTLTASGVVIRGEAVGPDWRSALDEVVDKLERQVKKYKERLGRRGVLRKGAVAESGVEEKEEEALPLVDKIARVKEFALRPMSVEDAILQMELLGHSFFIFKDIDKDKVQVIYKREDGSYGLIDPIY